MSLRKTRLRQQALRYFLRNGVSETTLRPLAAALGTSARLLVYHFGSKEGLVTAVIEEVQGALRSLFAAAFEAATSELKLHPLLIFWRSATEPRNLPLFRLLLEFQSLANRHPRRYRALIRRQSKVWLNLVADVLPREADRTARATLAAAVFDGLMIELLATGDRDRTTAAIVEFIRLCEAPARRTAGSKRTERA